MLRGFLLAAAALALAGPVLAADASGEDAGTAVLVNGRSAAMISLAMGATTVPGYSAKSSAYVKPGAALTVTLAVGSPCSQTVLAKFADGATLHRTVDVCAGPVTLGP